MTQPVPIIWIDDGVGPLGEPRAHSFPLGQALAWERYLRPIVAAAFKGDAKARAEIDAIGAHAAHPFSPQRGQCLAMGAIIAFLWTEADTKPIVESPAAEAAPVDPANAPPCRRTQLPETDPQYHPDDFPCPECEQTLLARQKARREKAEVARAKAQPQQNGAA